MSRLRLLAQDSPVTPDVLLKNVSNLRVPNVIRHRVGMLFQIPAQRIRQAVFLQFLRNLIGDFGNQQLTLLQIIPLCVSLQQPFQLIRLYGTFFFQQTKCAERPLIIWHIGHAEQKQDMHSGPHEFSCGQQSRSCLSVFKAPAEIILSALLHDQQLPAELPKTYIFRKEGQSLPDFRKNSGAVLPDLPCGHLQKVLLRNGQPLPN